MLNVKVRMLSPESDGCGRIVTCRCKWIEEVPKPKRPFAPLGYVVTFWMRSHFIDYTASSLRKGDYAAAEVVPRYS